MFSSDVLPYTGPSSSQQLDSNIVSSPDHTLFGDSDEYDFYLMQQPSEDIEARSLSAAAIATEENNGISGTNKSITIGYGSVGSTSLQEMHTSKSAVVSSSTGGKASKEIKLPMDRVDTALLVAPVKLSTPTSTGKSVASFPTVGNRLKEPSQQAALDPRRRYLSKPVVAIAGAAGLENQSIQQQSETITETAFNSVYVNSSSIGSSSENHSNSLHKDSISSDQTAKRFKASVTSSVSVPLTMDSVTNNECNGVTDAIPEGQPKPISTAKSSVLNQSSQIIVVDNGKVITEQHRRRLRQLKRLNKKISCDTYDTSNGSLDWLFLPMRWLPLNSELLSMNVDLSRPNLNGQN